MNLRRSRCIKLVLLAAWVVGLWWILQNMEHHTSPKQDRIALVTFAVKFSQHEWGSNQPMTNQAEAFDLDPDQVKKAFGSYMTLTLRNMLSYAQRWGIPFFFLNSGIVKSIVQNITDDPSGVHPYWAKSAVVKHYLDMKKGDEHQFDWILWTDIDVLFARFEIPLSKFIPTDPIDYDSEDGIHFVAPTECDFDPEFVSVTPPWDTPRQDTLVDVPKPWPPSFWQDSRINALELDLSKEWYNSTDWWEKQREAQWSIGEDVHIKPGDPREPEAIFPSPLAELKPPSRAVRSGFFLVRNTRLGRRFLQDWNDLWPAFKASPNPDQSALEYLVHGNHSLAKFWRSRMIMHSPFFHTYPECYTDATPFSDNWSSEQLQLNLLLGQTRWPQDLGYAYLGPGALAYSSSFPWHRNQSQPGYDGRGAFSIHFPAPTRKTEVASWYAKLIPDDSYGTLEELWFGPGTGNVVDNAKLILDPTTWDETTALARMQLEDVARKLHVPVVNDVTTLQVMDTATIPFQLKVRAMGYTLPTAMDWPTEVETRKTREMSGLADEEWNDRRLNMLDERWERLLVVSCGHQDDWQLFINPAVFHATSRSTSWYNVIPPRIVMIYLTAGDAGYGMGAYVEARERGALAGLRFLVDASGGGVGWDEEAEDAKDVSADRVKIRNGTVVVNGHKIKAVSYANTISYFLRLPDSNIDGLGFDLHNGAAVMKMHRGELHRITAVDNSATYQGWQDLLDTYKEIISREARLSQRAGVPWSGEPYPAAKPLQIDLHALDTNTMVNSKDHPDHTMASLLGQEAVDGLLKDTLVDSLEKQDGLPVVCASTNLHLAYVTGENLAVNLDTGTDDHLANVGTYAVSMAELKSGGGGNVFIDWAGHTLWLNKVYRRVVYPQSSYLARVNTERTKAAEARSQYDGVPPREVLERLCPMMGSEFAPIEMLSPPKPKPVRHRNKESKGAGTPT
jgi:hypothetical protein